MSVEADREVQWRKCPDCKRDWPHPSASRGTQCPTCFADDLAQVERDSITEYLENFCAGDGTFPYRGLAEDVRKRRDWML